MNERQFTAAVIDTCRYMGLLVHHCRPARTAKGWATPIQGSSGFPDLVICGPGGVLFRELKADNGVIRADQTVWLDTLERAGADVGVWRPRDWPHRVRAELDQLRTAAAS